MQDVALVREILEYRAAESAKDQHNQDATKMSEGQVQIWDAITNAIVEKKRRIYGHG